MPGGECGAGGVDGVVDVGLGASGTEPIRCSVVGEMTGMVASPDGRAHPPRM